MAQFRKPVNRHLVGTGALQIGQHPETGTRIHGLSHSVNDDGILIRRGESRRIDSREYWVGYGWHGKCHPDRH